MIKLENVLNIDNYSRLIISNIQYRRRLMRAEKKFDMQEHLRGWGMGFDVDVDISSCPECGSWEADHWCINLVESPCPKCGSWEDDCWCMFEV